MCLDRILLKKAQNGDIEAVEKLLKRYERYVFNTALGFFKNAYDASDAAQEAMIKIYRKINDFRGDASFRSWIFRITINVCKDILRKTKDILPMEDAMLMSEKVDRMTPRKKRWTISWRGNALSEPLCSWMRTFETSSSYVN